MKGQLLDAVQKRLRHLPSGSKLVHPALTGGKTAVEVHVGIFSPPPPPPTGCSNARGDRSRHELGRPSQTKKVQDTWELIDLKLGAFVRGQVLLIAFVSTLASLGFWVIGVPYFLLIGIAVGLLEIVPVIGPLAAIVLAAAAGLTASWHIAVYAAVLLLAIRLVEDYLVTPRVLGGAVGLSPLVVLVSVSATGILLGGFYVLLAIPPAAMLATLVDVSVRDPDPAEAEVPSVALSREGCGDLSATWYPPKDEGFAVLWSRLLA